MREGAAVGIDVATLYAAHRLALVRMAVLLVDSTPAAEDVVHDAFVGLYRKQGSIRDPDAAIGYLRRSVLNGARDALRRRRTARAYLRVADAAYEPAADEGALLSEEHADVLTAVRQLPKRDQEVLLLRYWSELSEAEIAETLGVSRGTVKSTASRALDKLQQVLEERR